MAMKFLIAPDSFKESVEAKQAAEAIKKGLEKAFVGYNEAVTYDLLPVADGGEGTMKVITEALGGTFVTTTVTGPLGTPVEAIYGYIESERKAIIEVAEACGLHLVPQALRNPLLTTTYGVGQMIQDAIKRGARELVIGLGGSATNDGGLGMLASLGAVVTMNEAVQGDYAGKDLASVQSISLEKVFETLEGIKISIACDVENPLVGPKGASHTFGPQKGATEEMVMQLDQGMQNFASVLAKVTGQDVAAMPKGGAAGGLGAAFMVLKATMQSGVSLVLDTLHFENYLTDCDYVITGEGSVDSQTADGKTISGITAMCQPKNIPVIVVAGRVADDIDNLYEMGVSAVFGIVDSAKSLPKALEDGEASLVKTSENIGRLIRTLK